MVIAKRPLGLPPLSTEQLRVSLKEGLSRQPKKFGRLRSESFIIAGRRYRAKPFFHSRHGSEGGGSVLYTLTPARPHYNEFPGRNPNSRKDGPRAMKRNRVSFLLFFLAAAVAGLAQS